LEGSRAAAAESTSATPGISLVDNTERYRQSNDEHRGYPAKARKVKRHAEDLL
jgi:hypothetical protein